MEIPNHIANEYILPKDYVKPDIAAGNYYLEWDSSSYGIAQKEIAGLKNLLNELLPYISSAIFDAAKEIPTIIQKKAAANKAMLIDEMFSPELLLTRRKGRNLAYTIRMKSDGTTILTRIEKIIMDNRRQICVSWVLGEVLFSRE